MVGIKVAQKEGPARNAASYVPQGRHLDLPPQLDWQDDFRELADCMLVIGNQKIKCHSQEKVIKLDECMEGVDAEAVHQLLMYMYSSDSISVISSMSLEQLEAAAVLADIWAIGHFLELSDALLHGRANLKECPAEEVLEWLLRASKCRFPRLQAKCEAFVAARFNELKYCARMEELDKDTWMRLMYISSYKAQGGKEAVLHRWITKGMPPKSNLGDRRTACTLPLLQEVTWQNETDF